MVGIDVKCGTKSLGIGAPAISSDAVREVGGGVPLEDCHWLTPGILRGSGQASTGLRSVQIICLVRHQLLPRGQPSA